MAKGAEEVIIVGGGLSGLGCAKRLHENGKSFKIISSDVGRVMSSPNGKVNYGAYYITQDCKNIMPYITLVSRMRISDYHFHRGKESYSFLPPRVLKYAPEISRLFSDLFRFRLHFNRMREKSLEHSREELIESDELLRKYYHQRAGDYIRERNIQGLVDEYLEQVLWASFFHNPRDVPTFIFMECLLPLIVPSYSFVLDLKKLSRPFRNSFIGDEIVKVSKDKEGIWVLKGKKKVYTTKKLVLATPMTITNTLVKPQKIKKTIDVSFYHVWGDLKPEYAEAGFNFFSKKEKTALSTEKDGSHLYFYKGKDNIKKYFSNYRIITHKSWKPALILLGDEYTKDNPQRNLFLANDHNVASTEDAFINGMYTAKLVMEN